MAVARITYAEVAAALARREREGALSRAVADAVFSRLAADFRALKVIEVRGAVLDAVPEIVRRYPLRGYDAVQLACALAAAEGGAAVTFWCADASLSGAAKGEGLRHRSPT